MPARRRVAFVYQVLSCVVLAPLFLVMLPSTPPDFDIACFKHVSSMVFSMGHLFLGTKDLATLKTPNLSNSVASGCYDSMFAMKSEK